MASYFKMRPQCLPIKNLSIKVLTVGRLLVIQSPLVAIDGHSGYKIQEKECTLELKLRKRHAKSQSLQPIFPGVESVTS